MPSMNRPRCGCAEFVTVRDGGAGSIFNWAWGVNGERGSEMLTYDLSILCRYEHTRDQRTGVAFMVGASGRYHGFPAACKREHGLNWNDTRRD